ATLFLLDLDTGKRLRTFQHTGKDKMPELVLSPDGSTLLGLSEDQHVAWVWDVATGKVIHRWHAPRRFSSLRRDVFSADGTRVALLGDAELEIFIYELAGGKRLGTVKGDRQFRYKTFSPDGKRLAASADDDSVGVWDVATGKRLCRFEWGM